MTVPGISYTLTVHELADATVEHSPRLRAGRRRCLVLGLVVALGGLYLITAAPVLAAVYLTYGFVVVLNNLRWFQTRAYRRAVAASPAMTEPVNASASEQGLHLVTATADLKFSWASYESVVGAPEGLALVQRGGAHVRWIPARAFAEPDQMQEWLSLATEGIAQAAIVAGRPS